MSNLHFAEVATGGLLVACVILFFFILRGSRHPPPDPRERGLRSSGAPQRVEDPSRR